VYVCRNHSFELVEHTIGAYLDYAGISLRFEYSDYDDSLSFINLDTAEDAVLLWIDTSRYQTENVRAFIAERIDYLRGIFKKHILVALVNDEEFVCNRDGILTLDLHSIKTDLAQNYLDMRLEKFSGTKLSSHALLEVSKMLGLKYFPAMMNVLIKAVVVDLDNTLYQGILGEDGCDGVVLTGKHCELQSLLVDLSAKGIFVCVASKNDRADAERLFAMRSDFPLKWSVFAKTCVSWNAKSQAIGGIKTFLNIHEENILFIDDNIGEIIEVLSVFPSIKVIQAAEDAGVTKTILENHPGIFRFGNGFEDSIRNDDIKANEKRALLKKSMTMAEYTKSLHIKAVYKINNLADANRIAELGNKTNQFIFSYKRYTISEIMDFFEKKSRLIVSIFLKDDLSDSGLIGAGILKVEANTAALEELFISCRALGRGIEDALVLTALQISLDKLKTDRLRINFTKGERNTPAEMFVQKYLKDYIDRDSVFTYHDDEQLLEVKIEG